MIIPDSKKTIRCGPVYKLANYYLLSRIYPAINNLPLLPRLSKPVLPKANILHCTNTLYYAHISKSRVVVSLIQVQCVTEYHTC